MSSLTELDLDSAVGTMLKHYVSLMIAQAPSEDVEEPMISAARRGSGTTLECIQGFCWWLQMEKDIKEFCLSCQ